MIEIYKKQITGTSNISASSFDTIFTLQLSGLTTSRVVNYDIKVLSKDIDNNNKCYGYYRGTAANLSGSSPSSYVTNQNISKVINQTNVDCIYILTTIDDIYDNSNETFTIRLENSHTSSNFAAKYTIFIELIYVI